MTAPAIELAGLSKSFGGVRVLHEVGLDVLPGEIHGLVGRNGSGKSTLIKILSGFHVPDPGGSLRVHGTAVPLPIAVGESHRLGLSFVHQDLGLTPTLTVLENLRVGRFATAPGWRIRWRRERAEVARQLERFELDVSPDAPVSSLSTVDRALLAIVRAFADLETHRQGVLILDEPTAYLPRDGVERLFAAIRRAAADGAGVVFVSHRLEEISGLTRRVSVLRDGYLAGTVETGAVTEAELIELIVGRRLEQVELGEHEVTDEVTLAADGLSGRIASGVSFEARSGEVLGLTGLVGMGHEEIPYLLFGARRARAGSVRIGELHAEAAKLSPRRAMAAGAALLPADRLASGGVGRLSVKENVTLPTLDRFFRQAFLHGRGERSYVRELLRAYDVRPPAPGRELGTLSGGNQQKALLAKWFQRRPQVILLHEPTQGVDVSAREEIYQQVKRVAGFGSAVVLCSSDYEDLARMCDRVLVFRDGHVVAELGAELLTEERIVEQCYATATA